MPIPLLRLPLLVLDEVIKNLEFRQLFPLSLCSKRMHLVVKNLRDKSIELELELFGGIECCFTLFDKKKREALFALYVKRRKDDSHVGWIVDQYRGTVFQETILWFNCWWENIEYGIRCLVEHLSDLFCVNVEKVVVHQNQLWVLDLVEELQGPRSYNAEIVHLTDDQLRHLLVDLNPTSLSLKAAPPNQFRVDNYHKTYDSLNLWHGNWGATGVNLLTLDCSKLRVSETIFSVAAINRFFRRVLFEGGSPRLTEFRGLLRNGEANDVLDGIRGVLAPAPGWKQFTQDRSDWTFSGMFEREGQSVFVCINCLRYYSQWYLYLAIGEEGVLDSY